MVVVNCSHRCYKFKGLDKFCTHKNCKIGKQFVNRFLPISDFYELCEKKKKIKNVSDNQAVYEQLKI